MLNVEIAKDREIPIVFLMLAHDSAHNRIAQSLGGVSYIVRMSRCVFRTVGIAKERGERVDKNATLT